MTELEQATTDELVDELGKRFASLVVITLKYVDESSESYAFTYFGGLTTAIGMARRAATTLEETGLIDEVWPTAEGPGND